MNNKSRYIFLLVFIATACSNNTLNPNKEIVAEVTGKVLYLSEIERSFNSQYAQTDSVRFYNNYIKDWITQQLLVTEAEGNLSSDELDIGFEMERYRQELLIHKYRNKRISNLNEEKIPYSQIEEYYNNNKKLFTLTHPIVRVNYVIFPSDIDVPDRISRILHSEDERSIANYEEFVFNFATRYDSFENNWIYLENLLRSVNHNINDIERHLRQNRIIKFNIDNEQHFIAIKEYRVSGQDAPIEFVAPRIRAFILNSKKLDFLREIKDSLYSNALKYDKFRVYN